jgi:hypothetical protein
MVFVEIEGAVAPWLRHWSIARVEATNSEMKDAYSDKYTTKVPST